MKVLMKGNERPDKRDKSTDTTMSRTNRQTSGDSDAIPQSLGCNTGFDMCLRATFIRRKLTVSPMTLYPNLI